MHVHGDAAAVVDNGDGVVFVYSDVDLLGISGQGLVDRVVHHLVDEVMKTFFGYIAYIHGRTLAYGLKPFEDLNITGAVFLLIICHWYFSDFFLAYKGMNFFPNGKI